MKACAPQAASPGLVPEMVLRLIGLFLLTPPSFPNPTLAAAGGARGQH